MAKRFSLSDVGHSASVFDEEKLAWVNRHYLKDADPGTARDASPRRICKRAGYISGAADCRRDARTWRASLPSSIRRSIVWIRCRERLRQLFEYSRRVGARRSRRSRAEVEAPGARQVIDALAEELAAAPRLVEKQMFRGVADRVKQKTGQKGRALFHPIRLALTGAGDGPELDLLVPAIDRGADLDRVERHRADHRRARARAAFADVARASITDH